MESERFHNTNNKSKINIIKENIMPGGDRTGPLGEGPMTGRQLGYGAGFNTPGYMQRFGFGGGRGRGRGLGMGLGLGYRNRYYNRNVQFNASEPEISQIKEEVNFLKNTVDSLLERLNRVNKEDIKR